MLIDGATRAALAGDVACEGLGTVAVRGHEAPVEVFAVTA